MQPHELKPSVRHADASRIDGVMVLFGVRRPIRIWPWVSEFAHIEITQIDVSKRGNWLSRNNRHICQVCVVRSEGKLPDP